MPLEYYNQNSLRKYPFKDSCSLVSNEQEQLLNDWFVDAQVTLHSPIYRRAYLTQISCDRATVQLHINATSFAGTDAVTVAVINVALTGGDYETVTGDTAAASVKLVIGPGLRAVASQAFTWTFPQANAEFAASSVLLFQPRVTAITAENIATSTNLPTTLTTFNASQPLVIEMGANMVIAGTPPLTMTCSVDAGKGTGLFDGCVALGYSPLYRINGVEPDEFGNMQVQTDTCYNKSMGAGWIAFYHACKGGCQEPDYKSLAYYINRLRDAANTLSAFAVVAKQNYDTAVSLTLARIEAAKRYRPPYLKMETSLVRGMKEDFASIALGILLPNKENIVGSLDVTLGTALTLVPATSSLTVDNVTIQQPDGPGFYDMQLGCKSTMFQKFAVKAPRLVDPMTHELLDIWNAEDSDKGYSIEATLIHNLGVAYMYLPLFKKYNWFSINYKYFYKLVGTIGEYHLSVDIGFFNSTAQEATTAFDIALPKGLRVTPGSLKLWADEAIVPITPADPEDPADAGKTGWELSDNVVMVFTKKNRMTFDAVWRGDPCTDTAVTNVALTFNPSFTILDALAGETHVFTKQFQISFQTP